MASNSALDPRSISGFPLLKAQQAFGKRARPFAWLSTLDPDSVAAGDPILEY